MSNFHQPLKALFVVSLATGCLFVAAGCSQHATSTASAPPLAPAAPAAPAPAPAASHVTIYHVATSKAQSQDANGLTPTSVALSTTSPSPAKEALEELATEPHSPLPRGTRVLSLTIDPASGLATADFSDEFRTNFAGGDTQEAQVITSVLQTLGQFPSIRNVQFLVGGKKIASLGGTQDLDQPLPVERPGEDGAPDKTADDPANAKQSIAMGDPGQP